MRKIAYLIHSLHRAGGMERVLTIKANALSEREDYDVTIITAALCGRKPFFELAPQVHVVDLGTGDSLGPQLKKYRKALSEALCTLKPDICISMGGNDIKVLPQMSDGSIKIAEFHFSHDKFLIKYGRIPLIGKPYGRWRTRRLERQAGRLAMMVVLTKEDARAWDERVPCLTQIYNPVTLQDAVVSPLERKRMVALGRLVPQKDFPSMIRAWRMVAQRHPDWTLDIYGEGYQKPKLGRMISHFGLDGKVRLMGVREHLQDELADSCGMVMSSAYEGFPLALLEGAASGLPLVSYDCSRGPSEIVKDGINGFLVRRGDEKGLADGICRLIEDPELRHEMGKQALKTSEAFSVEAIMSEWTNLFDSLLD